MESSGAALDRFYEQITHGELPIEFDKIGFLNIGYWKGVENSLEIAQINLIETLLDFLIRRDGNVLDVACGKGVSTKFLTKYFDPQKVTGVNISGVQLQVCRAIAPECTFKLMDATRLDFADSSFDNVLCLEAAQHFRTRQAFLKEAYRVLTPGGRLALHDVIFLDPDLPDAPNPEIWPKENYMASLDVYREKLLEVGFRYVRVEDITEFSMVAAVRYLARKLEKELDRKRSPDALSNAMHAMSDSNPWMPANCRWCFGYAIK
jgi:MPBQ/MSBQ methyltransferase